jgi:hypothetical protein
MLVAIDEVGQLTEGRDEGAQLRGDLDRQRIVVEFTRQCRAQCFLERQEASVAQRREAGAHRLERRGQRHMKAERYALAVGIEHAQRNGVAAIEMRRDDHHRGGVDSAAHDERADRGIDRMRDAVIVGTQPDVPVCVIHVGHGLFPSALC